MLRHLLLLDVPLEALVKIAGLDKPLNKDMSSPDLWKGDAWQSEPNTTGAVAILTCHWRYMIHAADDFVGLTNNAATRVTRICELGLLQQLFHLGLITRSLLFRGRSDPRSVRG
jgi:hypothetical protein